MLYLVWSVKLLLQVPSPSCFMSSCLPTKILITFMPIIFLCLDFLVLNVLCIGLNLLVINREIVLNVLCIELESPIFFYKNKQTNVSNRPNRLNRQQKIALL